MTSVLLLGPSLSAVSGVSTHLNQLFGSSLAREFRLVHFQVGSEGRKERIWHKVGRFVWSPFALAFKIVTSHIDIVHLNTSMDRKAFWRDTVYLLVSRLLRRKVVYQVHGGELPQAFFAGNALLTAFLKWLLQLPDAVVLLAEVERGAYQDFTRCKRLSVIPNAIDLNQYAWAEARSYETDRLRLVYIGRLAEGKGIHEAIEAFHILRQQGVHNLDFVIAGSGPAESALREQVKALQLEDGVRFAGPLFGDRKIAFWREADIFVFPTYREGLPYTILESLASATPVVTTRVGGIPDVIGDGVHGRFVELRDAEGIANAVRTMVLDRVRLREMSAECLARARSHYGIDRLAGQFSETYKAVVG